MSRDAMTCHALARCIYSVSEAGARTRQTKLDACERSYLCQQRWWGSSLGWWKRRLTERAGPLGWRGWRWRLMRHTGRCFRRSPFGDSHRSSRFSCISGEAPLVCFVEMRGGLILVVHHRQMAHHVGLLPKLPMADGTESHGSASSWCALLLLPTPVLFFRVITLLRLLFSRCALFLCMMQFRSETKHSRNDSSVRRHCFGVSEWVSSCLTAHQHNTGYSVPLMVECWNDLY